MSICYIHKIFRKEATTFAKYAKNMHLDNKLNEIQKSYKLMYLTNTN